MSDVVNKSDVQTFVNQYNSIKGSVTLIIDKSNIKTNDQVVQTPGPDIDTGSLESALIKKVSLDSLQNAVNIFETDFSNNCNCLHNYECCQSCQSECSGCQTCQYCESQCRCETCQGCQTCQLNCMFSTDASRFISFYTDCDCDCTTTSDN